jgi:hypothetical protein
LAYATWELPLITPTAIQTAAIYRFGHFAVDENNLSFTRSGEEVLLPIKPWSTLLLLAQHAPDTLSKAELMDAVLAGAQCHRGRFDSSHFAPAFGVGGRRPRNHQNRAWLSLDLASDQSGAYA